MIMKRERSESRTEHVRAMPSRERGRVILKDSIETAYSFLHQKRRSTFGRLLPTGRKNVYSMEVNPVLSSIMARRSIRKYLDKPVEHEKLEVIVKCGINAPSGMNAQPWIVRVVEDQKLIADVTEVYKQANAEQVKRDKDFKNMFRNAPNLICVCTPANGGGQLDAGLLGENIMLAAQSMGLGTCCLGGPVRFLLSNEKCKFFIERLDIPADYRLNYIIAIGYPDEQPDAKPRDASKVKFIK